MNESYEVDRQGVVDTLSKAAEDVRDAAERRYERWTRSEGFGEKPVGDAEMLAPISAVAVQELWDLLPTASADVVATLAWEIMEFVEWEYADWEFQMLAAGANAGDSLMISRRAIGPRNLQWIEACADRLSDELTGYGVVIVHAETPHTGEAA